MYYWPDILKITAVGYFYDGREPLTLMNHLSERFQELFEIYGKNRQAFCQSAVDSTILPEMDNFSGSYSVSTVGMDDFLYSLRDRGKYNLEIAEERSLNQAAILHTYENTAFPLGNGWKERRQGVLSAESGGGQGAYGAF